jgi:ribonuclease HI
LVLTADDGKGLVSQIFEKLNKEEEAAKALVTARMIWLRRNNFVFDNVFSPPASVIERSKQFMANFKEAFYSRNRPPESPPSVNARWTPPPADMWKINVDAAVDQTTMKMGVGVVIRDSGG